MSVYHLHDLSYAFQFSFNIYAIFTLLTAFLNLILSYLLLKQKVKTLTHYFLALLTLLTFVWGIFETLARSSTHPIGASYWISLFSVGWTLLPPTFLAFCLSFVGKTKMLSNFLFLVLLYAPSVIFLTISLTTDLVDNHSIELYTKTYYGWTNPVGPVYVYLATPWIAALNTIGLWLLIKYRLKLLDPIKRKQTNILIGGTIIPFLGVFVTELLFPLFDIQSVSKFGLILTSISCLFLTYGIIKYKLFVINPATIVSNIVETMHEILIVFSPKEYRIEYVNHAVEKVLGYTIEQLQGQHLSVLLGDNWLHFQNNILTSVEHGNEISSIETELIAKNSQKIPINFSASPYKSDDGAVISIVSVITDIRQLKQLLSVTAEKAKLHVVIESISDGVIALDHLGRVTMLNNTALKILKVQPQQIIGKRLDELFVFSDEKGVITTHQLLPEKEVVEDTIVLKKENIQISSQNGKSFVNLISSAIKEGKQAGVGAIVTLHDITEERALEQMKLDFVSIAAHELRTPITTLRGYLYILKKEYQHTFDEKEKHYIDRIDLSIQRLMNLIESLLNVTNIEKGSISLSLHPLNLKESINEVISQLADAAKEKNISITFTPPAERLPLVIADKTRINEVLTNLIINAIHFTETNGQITIWMEITPDEIVTHIKDNGKGIPSEAIPYLFTKFFKVVEPLEQGSKGTGLGLYIAKSIIQMHHGRIWAESEGVGKGSTFSFSLPIIHPAV